LKDAILLAAEAVGRDGKGLDGLVGYLTSAAINHPKNFLFLLARVLPYQVAFKNPENLQGISDKMTPQEAVQTYLDTLRGLQQGLRTPQLIDVSPGSPAGVRGAARD